MESSIELGKLIDGCIRIFDYLAKVGLSNIDEVYNAAAPRENWQNISEIVCGLHDLTSIAHSAHTKSKMIDALVEAVKNAMCWIARNGIDPWELLFKKHSYNKCRPYKHGKLF